MIKLNQIKPNFTVIIFHNTEDSGDHLKVYFSYQTMIAFELNYALTISENEWGPTTGKHLNYINPDKTKRIPRHEVERKFFNTINLFIIYRTKKEFTDA